MLRPLSHPAPLAGRPTEGPTMVRWIEALCTYGEGDKQGEPVRLELYQKYLLHHLGELNPDGNWRYKRALWEFPKGNGKTPLNAWVLLYLLTHRRSPVIPVGATSFAQADLLYGDMKACVDSSDALQRLMEAYEDRIVLKLGAGRAYKISAKGGTNDGSRPSAYGADEIHELVTAEQQKAYRNTARGIVKRKDGIVLATTTPGADLDGLLGRLHVQGLKTNAGEAGGDPRLLFVWYGAPGEGVPLDDPVELARLIRLANPAADLFLDVEEHIALAGTMPAFEFERYHLGRWTQVLAAWLAPGAWDGCLDKERAATRTATRPGIPLGADVVLGFDGSWNGDSTALVAVDLDGMVVGVVAAWEKPEDARPGWHVPAAEVEAAVRKAFTDYRVRELAYDRRIWHQMFEELDAEGYPVVEVPQGQHMVDAATRFYVAVAQKTLRHDGDPRLTRHVGNCVGVATAEGVRVQKESRSSTRWIDLAIAAVMAHDHAAAVTQDAGVLVY
jgi:phage terminase large subunit-like protein